MEHADVMLAAAVLREVSIEGMILLVFNVLMAVGFTVGSFSVRRLVRQNDEEHRQIAERSDQQDERIERSLEKLLATVEAEREARHQLAVVVGREPHHARVQAERAAPTATWRRISPRKDPSTAPLASWGGDFAQGDSPAVFGFARASVPSPCVHGFGWRGVLYWRL